MILQYPIMLKHVKWQMMNIPGGVGDKMEDWVERLHQWGMQQCWRFYTVQNLLVCARNTHSDVLAQVDATDKGNKQKLSEKKVDIISTKRKMQQEEGHFKAIRYIDNIKEDKLTWVEALFSNDKGPTGGGKLAARTMSVIIKKNF